MGPHDPDPPLPDTRRGARHRLPALPGAGVMCVCTKGSMPEAPGITQSEGTVSSKDRPIRRAVGPGVARWVWRRGASVLSFSSVYTRR
jgi:hypothetical protein